MLPNCYFQPNTEPSIPSTSSGGTVTSFSFTNGKGFTGVVTNPTTTPDLSLTYAPLFTTTATAAGTTTLTNVSNPIQAFTGVTTQTIKLPVTTTLATGYTYKIINQSSGTLTIQTGGASAITTILGGLEYEFICIDATSDVAASWYWRVLYNDAIPVANGGTGQTSLPSTNNASQIVVRDSNKNAFATNFVNAFTTTATAAGTTTLTVASNQNQAFTGSTTQTVKLPVTTTLSNGFVYVITNKSSGTLTIQTGGASAITTILSGLTAIFTCIDNSSDVAASWNYNILGKTITTTIPHTFTVNGTVAVPSGDTDFIIPMTVPVPTNQTVTLVGARGLINSGTSVTCKLQKGSSIGGLADITGYTSMSVSTTVGSIGSGSSSFSNNDLLALVVTAVSGTPKNMMVTVILQYQAVIG